MPTPVTVPVVARIPFRTPATPATVRAVARIPVASPSAGGVLATDSFAGADGDPLSPVWVPGLAQPGTSVTILGNAAHFVTGPNGGYSGLDRVSRRLNIARRSDAVAKFRLKYTAGNETYPRYYVRANESFAENLDSQSGYWVELTYTVDTWAVGWGTGYNNVDLAEAAFPFEPGQFYWVIFGAVGSTIRFAIWADGAPMPSAWTAQVTDSSIAGAGETGFSVGGGNVGGRAVDVDDFQLFDSFPTLALAVDTVPARAAVPSPTITGGAQPAPAVVAGSVTVPAPTVRVSTAPAPTVVLARAAVATPTALAGSSASPGVAAALAAVGMPVVQASSRISPAVVIATATVGAPVVPAGSAVAPAVVLVVAALPAPAVTAVPKPDLVAVLAAIGAPRVRVTGAPRGTRTTTGVRLPHTRTRIRKSSRRWVEAPTT